MKKLLMMGMLIIVGVVGCSKPKTTIIKIEEVEIEEIKYTHYYFSHYSSSFVETDISKKCWGDLISFKKEKDTCKKMRSSTKLCSIKSYNNGFVVIRKTILNGGRIGMVASTYKFKSLKKCELELKKIKNK